MESSRAVLSVPTLSTSGLWFQNYPEGTCKPSPLRALSIIWAALHRSLASLCRHQAGDPRCLVTKTNMEFIPVWLSSQPTVMKVTSSTQFVWRRAPRGGWVSA